MQTPLFRKYALGGKEISTNYNTSKTSSKIERWRNADWWPHEQASMTVKVFLQEGNADVPLKTLLRVLSDRNKHARSADRGVGARTPRADHAQPSSEKFSQCERNSPAGPRQLKSREFPTVPSNSAPIPAGSTSLGISNTFYSLYTSHLFSGNGTPPFLLSKPPHIKMTTRRIISSEKTILDKDDVTSPTAPSGKSNTAPAVPA